MDIWGFIKLFIFLCMHKIFHHRKLKKKKLPSLHIAAWHRARLLFGSHSSHVDSESPEMFTKDPMVNQLLYEVSAFELL